MEFNCLKATEPLRQHILLLTTKSPRGSGTQLIDYERIKGWVDLEPPNGFEARISRLGIQCLNH